MSISYRSFTAGHPSLKFSPGLILGWMTTDRAYETRYALYSDGRVLKSEPVSMFHKDADNFAPKGRKWTAVDAVPEHAEFIGNYKPPR